MTLGLGMGSCKVFVSLPVLPCLQHQGELPSIAQTSLFLAVISKRKRGWAGSPDFTFSGSVLPHSNHQYQFYYAVQVRWYRHSPESFSWWGDGKALPLTAIYSTYHGNRGGGVSPSHPHHHIAYEGLDQISHAHVLKETHQCPSTGSALLCCREEVYGVFSQVVQ